MKLKLYDQNAQNRFTKPRISFGFKTNQIRFNNQAVKLMNLKTGDKIAIAMNEDNTEECIPLGVSTNDDLFFYLQSACSRFFRVV